MVRILSTDSLIEDACAILYQVYIEEMQWKFNKDNPSLIRIEERNGRKLLLDRFIHKSVWFGVFYDDKLIGCARLSGLDENNLYEVESYPNSKMIHEYLPRKNCFEMSRVCVLSEYKGYRIMNQLCLKVFEYCMTKQCSIFGCSTNQFLKSLLSKIKFPLKIEQAFKYESHDFGLVNFYFSKHENDELKDVIYNLKKTIINSNSAKCSVLEALEIVAPILPIPIYWHDTLGVVLGINEHCLTGMGTSRESVVGKSPYDFHKKEFAEYILKHNEQIMRTGEISSQDESFSNLSNGKLVYAKSIKAPLYDEDGNVIGIVGSSIDITPEKTAEQLRLDNERLKFDNESQQLILNEQKKFSNVVRQVNHDIGSPLASLRMLIGSFAKVISEKDCNTYMTALDRINDITSNMLRYFKKENFVEIENKQILLASVEILEIITEKRYEYSDRSIKFNSHFNNSSFACLSIGLLAFNRMLSNIINNSVDARATAVDIYLEEIDNDLQIIIQDNGIGIAEHIKDKILNDMSITSDKEHGNGIGFSQVRKTIADNHGKLEIETQLNSGTKIILTFPKINTPAWLVDNIKLNPQDSFVILTTKNIVKIAWQDKLKGKKVNYFDEASALTKYIKSLTAEERRRIVFLTDYDLSKHDITGLDIIERLKIKRSMLVTNKYNKIDQQNNIKILPRTLISQVNIELLYKEETKQEEVLDLVIVDNNEEFVKNLTYFLLADKKIAVYDDPLDLLDEVTIYSKKVKFIIDYDATDSIDLINKLESLGYSNCYFYVDYYIDSDKVLKKHKNAIMKSDLDGLLKILKQEDKTSDNGKTNIN